MRGLVIRRTSTANLGMERVLEQAGNRKEKFWNQMKQTTHTSKTCEQQ